MQRLSPEQFQKVSPMYVESILKGMEKYSYEIIEGSKEELYECIVQLALKEGYDNTYADCYYASIGEEARDNIRKLHSVKEYGVLEQLQLKSDELFLSMTPEVIDALLRLSIEETLFSSFYFVKSGYIIWSNYEQKFPIFFRDEIAKDNFHQWWKKNM